jgi:hypothetical protein
VTVIKTRLLPGAKMKSEDVPAPSRAQFEGFMKALVSVPKAKLDRREAKYQKNRKKSL